MTNELVDRLGGEAKRGGAPGSAAPPPTLVI
jgi:hypothetical protein